MIASLAITCFDAFLSSPAPIGQIIFALEIGRGPWLLFCQVSSSRKKSANQIKEISCDLSLVDWTAAARDVTLRCPQGWPSSHCGQRHPVRHPKKLYLKVPVTSECLNNKHVKMTGCFVKCLLPYDIDDIDICCFFLKIRWSSQISNLKYSMAKQKECLSSITVYNIT